MTERWPPDPTPADRSPDDDAPEGADRPEADEASGPGGQPPTTRRLVDEFLARNPEAERELDRLVREVTARKLTTSRLWRRRLRRKHEEGDVVSELWQRVLASDVLARFEWRFSGSLVGELGTILDRQLVDMNRRLSADKRGGGDDPLPLDAGDPDGPRPIDPPARDPTPSAEAWTREAREWVGQRLDPFERRVLELLARGLSRREVAARLEAPSGKIRKAVARIEELYRRYRDG